MKVKSQANRALFVVLFDVVYIRFCADGVWLV